MPLPLAFQVLLLPGECWRAGVRAVPGSCAAAFMPAIQGSQKIGLGNSLKVITWDSGDSRWLLRAAPKCSGDASSVVHFQDFSLFFMFISGWTQSWGKLGEYS